MKTAAIVALVAIAGTDAKINGTIGNSTVYGNTESKGNRTNGVYEYNGTIDGKKAYYKKEYVIIGNKTKEERKKLSKEDRKKEMKEAFIGQESIVKFDKYFYYAIQTKNQKIGGKEAPQCNTSDECQ